MSDRDELVARLRGLYRESWPSVRDAADQIERDGRKIERLVAERDRLREALAGLELACDQLAATRTREVYLAMIDSGQQAALLFLDSHRESARAALNGEGET